MNLQMIYKCAISNMEFPLWPVDVIGADSN